MTARINKSAIAGIHDFPALAAGFAVEMKNWRAHMARVKEDEEAGVTGIEKHCPHPKPGAHPLIERAVNENCEADYEIVDDGPTPDQVLADRKAELMHVVAIAEQKAIAAVLPIGKRRLLDLRENAIRQAHAGALARKSIIQSLATAVGLGKDPEMAPADAAFLDDQAERRRKFDAIELRAAQAHHDIEDLAPETIDAWKIPDFTI